MHTKTVSWSRSSLWASCAMKYHFKHVEKLKEPWAEPLAFGAVVHHLLEALNRESSIDESAADIAAYLEPRALARFEVTLSWALPGSEHPPLDPLAAEAAQMAAAWYHWPQRERSIVEVEAPRTRDITHLVDDLGTGPELYGLPHDTRVILEGRLDAIADRDGAPVIVEYKTSSKLWDAFEFVMQLQPEFYAYLLNQEVLERHEILVRRTKTLPPRFLQFERRVAPAAAVGVEQDLRAFLDHGAIPARNRGKHCRRCGYVGPCFGEVSSSLPVTNGGD